MYLQTRVKSGAKFRPSNPNCYRKVQYPTPIEWKISHKIAYVIPWYDIEPLILSSLQNTHFKRHWFQLFQNSNKLWCLTGEKKGWHWISQVWVVKRMKMWWKTKHQIPLSWIMVSFRKLPNKCDEFGNPTTYVIGNVVLKLLQDEATLTQNMYVILIPH